MWFGIEVERFKSRREMTGIMLERLEALSFLNN